MDPDIDHALKRFCNILVMGLTVLWTASACHFPQTAGEISGRGAAATGTDVSEINSQQFALEIDKLEKKVVETPAGAELQNSHLRLAYLYMSHTNPQRNYSLALRHLNAYLAIAGDAGMRPELTNLQSLLAALTTLERQRDICDQEIEETQNRLADLEHRQRSLNERLRQSRAANDRLAGENAKLRQTLDILRTIDRKLEEKRKSYR